MLHSHRSSERRIRFNDNVVLFAKRRNVCPCIEWVYFDLIDGRRDTRFRVEKLSQLASMSASYLIALQLAISLLIKYVMNNARTSCIARISDRVKHLP